MVATCLNQIWYSSVHWALRRSVEKFAFFCIDVAKSGTWENETNDVKSKMWNIPSPQAALWCMQCSLSYCLVVHIMYVCGLCFQCIAHPLLVTHCRTWYCNVACVILQASHSRARACSISLSIDDLHDRRLLPVDKSMALNIEKRAAEEEEEKLVMQGLPDDEVSFD